MSTDSMDDDDITSAEAFDTALEQLLRKARRGGVDVRGSWVYRTGELDQGLEIMVFELDATDARK